MDLFDACEFNRLQDVKTLMIVDGAHVNLVTDNHRYTYKGEWFSPQGEELDYFHDGTTPLNVACQNGNSEIVKILLASEYIRVNQPDSKGITPLHSACFVGHSETVRMLLAVDGIQINQVTKNGHTPLNTACHTGHSKVVKMLLAVGGIQVNQAAEGWTPLNNACHYGHSKVVKMLLAVDGIQVNQANDNGRTPFTSAVANRHTAIVILLLQRGIGHNNINEWFHFDNLKAAGRIALYKYAVLLSPQHQPLLDFHLCLLNTQNALVPTSSLKAFSRIWPQLVAFKIESFLLPTKQTRRTMQQVISYFNETLNETDTYGETQLYEATHEVDVDSVLFLSQHEGILVNQLSTSIVIDSEENEEHQLYETSLNCALRLINDLIDDDVGVLNEELSDVVEIIKLLRAVGGTSALDKRGKERLAECASF